MDEQHIIESSMWSVIQFLKYRPHSRQYTLQFVPKDIVLAPISFRCVRVVGPRKDFVAIWIPVGLSGGSSQGCDLLTYMPLCDYERDWHLIGLWSIRCVTAVSSVARTSSYWIVHLLVLIILCSVSVVGVCS